MQRFSFIVLLFLIFPALVFSQQAASSSSLRDYVGLINQSYHPGVVAFFEKIKTELSNRGETNAVKSIDIFLGGATGSGFVYSDAAGNLYVITNNHVISQAHTLSITFERQDGYKRKLENLKVIAADEESDLALMSFAAGDKPVSRGLGFLSRQVQEGEDVYSAGFPGVGATPIWQFGRGMVSNAFVKFPKSIFDETLMGPYIQHTAQIDPGNSGGPLLIAQQNVPTGYAVAGVNTLSGISRQAANYAIPVSTVQAFISDSLNQKPETFRAALDQRLAKFAEGLGGNSAVYPHISEYLSSTCIGENSEYAMEEMYEKSNASVRRTFIEKCEEGVVGAMGYAVAWTIENSIRGQGAIRAALKEVTGAGEEYTVVFTINNKDHSSKWVREYGNWRIRSFGTVAAGDRSLISKRETKRETEKKLRVQSNRFHVEAGYASLFKKAPAALYVAADYSYLGAQLYFAGPDFFSIGAFFGYRFSIPAGNFGFMPYMRLGFDYQFDKEYENYRVRNNTVMGFPIAIFGQFGLKVTTSYVPGLFLGIGFQYNFLDMMSTGSSGRENYTNKAQPALTVTAGYAF